MKRLSRDSLSQRGYGTVASAPAIRLLRASSVWSTCSVKVKWAVHNPAVHLFFPSCASVALARSSHIVVLSERITQVHTLYPSLGVRKWSIEQSVRSLVSPHEETGTKQSNTKPKQSKHKQKTEKGLTRQLQTTTASKVPVN